MGKYLWSRIAPSCCKCLVDTKSVKSVISCLSYSSHRYFVVFATSWPLTTFDKQFQSHSLMGASQLLLRILHHCQLYGLYHGHDCKWKYLVDYWIGWANICMEYLVIEIKYVCMQIVACAQEIVESLCTCLWRQEYNTSV